MQSDVSLEDDVQELNQKVSICLPGSRSLQLFIWQVINFAVAAVTPHLASFKLRTPSTV
jgi:hypothetical protein